MTRQSRLGGHGHRQPSSASLNGMAGSCPAMTILVLQLSNNMTRRRASSPLSSATGQAVLPVPSSPKRERAERVGKRAASATRPLARRTARCRSKVNGTRARLSLCERGSLQLSRGLGSSLSPAFRTRMDLSACWMSQGWLLAPASPRSCELSPGHSLVPSAPFAVVRPRPPSLDHTVRKRHPEPDKACGPPRPVPRRRTTAARSVSVRDVTRLYSPSAIVKNKRGTLATIFLRTRNTSFSRVRMAAGARARSLAPCPRSNCRAARATPRPG